MLHVDGTCHCGTISVRAEIDETKVVVCHCLDCQILSGSPFRVVAPVSPDKFEITGNARQYVKTAASGRHRIQAFCADCGTPLYASDPDDPGGIVSLRTGFLNQRAIFMPSMQIWHNRAQPWIDDLCRIRAFEAQAPSKA